MSGSVRIARTIWEDPAFKDEPFTEREAFIWLTMEASFKPREKMGVSLARGQLAGSLRFFAKAWGWQEPRVRRYFDRLENRRMITRVADAGITVVTICNYDKDQGGKRVADAADPASPTHHRRIIDANENKGKEGEIRKKDDDESAREALPDSGDGVAGPPSFFEAVLAAARLDPDDLPPGWEGPAAQAEVDRWAEIAPELTPALILAEVAKQRARFVDQIPGRPKAFEGGLTRLAARLAAPPPTPAAGAPPRPPTVDIHATLMAAAKEIDRAKRKTIG